MPLIKNFLYQFSQRQQNAPHESGVRFFPLLRRIFVLLVGIWLFICVFLPAFGYSRLFGVWFGFGFGLDLGLGLGLGSGLGLLILIYTYTYLYLFMFILRRLKADAAYSLS